MELRTYFRPLLKWWWLLLAAGLVAAVSSFIVMSRQPLIYQSRTTLVVGSSVYERNPQTGDFYLNEQLAGFYADLAMRTPIQQETMKVLNLAWLPEYTASTLPSTPIIEILVNDTDPLRSQAVANELAAQLIKQTPANDPLNTDRREFIETQLNQFEADIVTTQKEINDKAADLSGLTSARQIADTQADIRDLEDKLSSLRSSYAALLASSDRGAGNTLRLIEPASQPGRPLSPNTLSMVLLSTAIAVSLAAAAAYLIEYLDDTFKSPEEVTKLLDLPVVGFISDVERGKSLEYYLTNQPRSAIAEAFRSLRTDLEFSGVDKPLKTIYVTGTEVEAGKTSIAINLAIVIAQSGKRVILIDADLRRPNVHRMLSLTNQKGLSDVFRGTIDIYNATIPYKEGNIFIVPSGSPPPNPAELLSSKKMDQILESLKKVADVVIVDGPPFMVTDSQILASKVDGVLLVLRYGFSRKNAAVTALQQLQRVDARPIGVVLNRIPRSASGYYGYGMYHYYPGYYLAEEESNEKSSITDKLRPPRKSSPKEKSSGEALNLEKTES